MFMQLLALCTAYGFVLVSRVVMHCNTQMLVDMKCLVKLLSDAMYCCSLMHCFHY